MRCGDRVTIFRFTNNELAAWFARKGKANMIILGDDGYYWVVTAAQAVRLVKQGYEYAPVAY
jgi:hypothetical protein